MSKTAKPVKVKMVKPENGKINMKYIQTITGMTRFGKEIKITPKANAIINEAGYKHEYYVDSVSVTVGIGNDYVADLTMTLEAWKALKKGAKIHITTTKEFKEKYGNF